MKIKIEIRTKNSFYRIVSGKWGFHLWRYFKRHEAQSQCWLIWRVLLGLIDIECYALQDGEYR